MGRCAKQAQLWRARRLSEVGSEGSNGAAHTVLGEERVAGCEAQQENILWG